jgi:hypothetical protein
MNKFIVCKNEDKTIFYSIDKITSIKSQKASYGKKKFHLTVCLIDGGGDTFEFLTEAEMIEAASALWKALCSLQ